MAAIQGTEFCDSHLPVPPSEEALQLPFAYRLARRVGAAILLAMFLTQFYIGMRLLLGW